MAVRPQVKAQIAAYFAERAGQMLYVVDIAQTLNLTVEQARTGINNLRNSPAEKNGGIDFRDAITVVARGNCWVYRPAPIKSTTATKRLFEEIGQSSKGLVIQDADSGALYLATEL